MGSLESQVELTEIFQQKITLPHVLNDQHSGLPNRASKRLDQCRSARKNCELPNPTRWHHFLNNYLGLEHAQTGNLPTQRLYRTRSTKSTKSSRSTRTTESARRTKS